MTSPEFIPAYRHDRAAAPCWRPAAIGLLAVVMALLASPASTTWAADAAPAKREYVYQQAADTALLIRIDPFETEFESRIYGPDDRLLKASGIAPLRNGPVFQLVDPVKSRRSLRIEVTYGHRTRRGDLNLQWIKLDDSGPDNRLLTQAYRMLSFGLERLVSGQADSLTMKVAALSQAAAIFDQLGMQELQLWSTYYSTHYLLTLLGDAVSAAAQAAAVNTAASRARLPQLVLAAFQLEGSALAIQAMQAGDVQRARLFDRTQAVFGETEQLAAQGDFQYERSRAIYQSGLAYEAAQQPEQALQQFQRAVESATASGDADLANQIRKHAAELQESLGNTAAAITLMREISGTETGPAPQAGAGPVTSGSTTGAEETARVGGRAERDMARYLVEQGRLLEKTYRHAEAVEVLRQALDLDRSAPSPDLTGPAGILLGRALYGAGRMDEAVPVLNDYIHKTPAARYAAVLSEAFSILAAIYRGRGDFDGMKQARQRQLPLVKTPFEQAGFKVQQALDHLAEGQGQTAALALLREAKALARQSGATDLEHLASLRICALGQPGFGPGEACDGSAGQAAVDQLQLIGWPEARLQARLSWSDILRRNGHTARSADEIDNLIDELQFFQIHLPGVLGAWYWQQREALFGAYMQLMLRRAGGAATAAGLPAAQALAALDRLRAIDQAQRERQQSAARSGADAQPDVAAERLRSLLAERQDTLPGSVRTRLDQEIAPQLTALRANAGRSAPGRGGERLLQSAKRLSSDEALLAYYFAADRAYGWVLRNSGVALFDFPWSTADSVRFSRDLEALRWDAANGNAADFASLMDRLGHTLLGPIAGRLPEVVYFMPTGPLEGFPLDALRWQKNFLAEHHRVVNVLSLEALDRPLRALDSGQDRRIFLAGNRRERAGDFELAASPSAEVTVLAEQFAGPGMTIVQGAALQWDEFQDERFAGADFIHLAVPGEIDLREPGQSRLLLSDNPDGGPAYLAAADIAHMNLTADLAVLSACDVTGSSSSAFDINNRLVAGFLQAGAGSVIASLWTVGDAEAARFMHRLYQNLSQTPDPARALAATKAHYLDQQISTGLQSWAAFQVFVN